MNICSIEFSFQELICTYFLWHKTFTYQFLFHLRFKAIYWYT